MFLVNAVSVVLIVLCQLKTKLGHGAKFAPRAQLKTNIILNGKLVLLC
jgi:hypothetical protein